MIYKKDSFTRVYIMVNVVKKNYLVTGILTNEQIDLRNKILSKLIKLCDD